MHLSLGVSDYLQTLLDTLPSVRSLDHDSSKRLDELGFKGFESVIDAHDIASSGPLQLWYIQAEWPVVGLAA